MVKKIPPPAEDRDLPVRGMHGCLQVLEIAPGRKDLVDKLDHNAYLHPVLVQPMEVWCPGGRSAALPTEIEVFAKGLPFVIDGLNLCPWVNFTRELVHWSYTDKTDSLDGIRLTKPVDANDFSSRGLALEDARYPAYGLTKMLAI